MGEMMKKRLNVSFSGGRTSAYMTKMLLENYADEYDFLVTFANTGQEHEATLEFVRDCDKYLGFNTVWLEAIVSDDAGTAHIEVDYNTAARNGRPFVDVVAKYGISNQAWPHCTRELKLQPMTKYLKSVGWSDCDHAIGIRVDETRRVSKTAELKRIVYPMVDWFPTTKQGVIDFWQSMPFDLGREQFPPHGLPERLGNCVWCWKKSYHKLIANVREDRSIFDFPNMLEREYGNCGKNEDGFERVFFRGNRSTQDVLAMADCGQQLVLMLTEQDIIDDIVNPCGESCEFLPMESKP